MLFTDPDTETIEQACRTLVGHQLQISFTITSPTGGIRSGVINNCNIIGDCMEDIVFPVLKTNVPTFEEGPNQKSPDFWNRDEWEWELKCFRGSANFDLGKITGYIDKLSRENGVNRKLFKTRYIVYEYGSCDGGAEILEVGIYSVWDLCCGYGGKKPINIGGGKGDCIRPATKNQWVAENLKEKRTPTKFLDRIESLINSKWYKVDPEEKERELKSIREQRTTLGI